MPDISVGSQIFDLVFHPSHSTVYTALLSGKIKAFAYNEEGHSKQVFSVKLSQKSCRGITISEDGGKVYAVGKGKGLHTLDTATGKLVESRAKAHEVAINRVKNVTSWLLATGDDDGVIKLWDPRKKESVRNYAHHFDYITDFLWLEDKRQLVATSGDGTLSVMDVRAKTSEPFDHSEDQEDELLSIVPIKGATKIIVGTQLGVLSIFNRSSGWKDCVDRIPGHPQSVDALCALPASLPNVDHTSTILSGSSDGFVRAVSVFPTKLQGVVADHGEWPIERIAVGEGMRQLTLDDDEGDSIERRKLQSKSARPPRSVRKGNESASDDDSGSEASAGHFWAGSAGHDEFLKLTNLRTFFDGQVPEPKIDERQEDDGGSSLADDEVVEDREFAGSMYPPVSGEPVHKVDDDDEPESDSSAEPEASIPRKRKKKEKEPLALKKKRGRNEVEVEGAFFAEL